ncbi:uncharacterized protein LOC122059589 [Macadamia integrifolia]|uniref:uncharacterized protein LOC122059589 n=1 Tax=Macadamia integrifolia TaxID=60698 RepID=UPI001C529DE5|nr:uncharacterized protein LOC122059589 [Macadamia integrifolia]
MDVQKSPGQQEQFLLQRERKADNLPGSWSSKRSVSPSKKALRIKLKVNSHNGHGGASDFSSHEEQKGHTAHNHNLNQCSGKENRICKVCKKGFSSGRALGGHMRVHAQLVQEKRQEEEEQLPQFQFQDILPISPDTNKNNTTTQIIPNKHHHGNNKKSVIGSYGGAAGRPMNSMNSRAHIHPKSTKMMKTTIDHNSNSSDPSCFLCGKNFRSMKSLFGHMRCHPEREWRGIQPPLPPSPSDPPPQILAAPKTTSISSASTLSDKDSSGSAYRYHHHGGKLKTNTTTDDHQLGSSLLSTARSAINLAKSLSSWSITAKRGRQAIHAAVPPPSDTASASASAEEQQPMPTDADTDAAYQLMMLSHDNPLSPAFPSHSYPYSSSDRIEDPLQTMGDLSKRRRRDDDNEDGDESQSAGARNSEYLPQPIIRKIEEDDDDKEDEGELGSKTSTDDDYSSLIRGHRPDESDQLSCMFEMALGQKVKKHMRRKKKKMKLRDLERVIVVEMGPIDYKKQQHDPTTPSLSDRFKCRTCNKTFPSHQALGGHRSSHKMSKNVPIITTTDVDDDLTIDPSSTGGGEESKTQAQSPYRCKICSKTFPTGQALGGHQRCHWTGLAEAVHPSSSVASPEEDISKAGERMMLDFDLNEMPAAAMEEDDDDDVDEEVVKSVCFTQSQSLGIAAITTANNRPGQVAADHACS